MCSPFGKLPWTHWTHYITPLKARDLSSVSTSNAPRNTYSDVPIANRGLRTRDLRVFLLECFMGFLRYSFMVWWVRALNRASRASNPIRMYCWYIFLSSCTSFVLRGARPWAVVRDSLPSNFAGLKWRSNKSDTFMSYSYKLMTQKQPTADHGTWAVKNGQGSRGKNGNKVPWIRIGDRGRAIARGGDSRWGI